MPWHGTGRPPRGTELSSEEIERFYPHTAPIIRRAAWTVYQAAAINAEAERIDADHQGGGFNSIEVLRFQRPGQAAEMAEFALANQLHRLVRDDPRPATREEVAAEWRRMAEEREQILAWGRRTGLLREVVQTYRFERRCGMYSYAAHTVAARLVAAADPAIADPMNHAGVLIEWAEREHRAWFWRCCRRHHVL